MRKILWLAISALMALSLVLAACGQAVEQKPTTPAAPSTATPAAPATPAPTTPAPPAVTEKKAAKPAADVPQYGGVLTQTTSTDPTNFDEGVNRTMSGSYHGMTGEKLAMWDWTRGPAGTGELTMTANSFHRQQFNVGAMAESWEIEPGHIVLHIRKGVHFALNPANEASRLVGGREMTADDVSFTYKRLFTEPAAYLNVSYPALAKAIKITQPDKYTVDLKTSMETFMDLYHTHTAFVKIIAPELVQKYGNLESWKVQVATGPFMLTDYIPGSLVTFIRNPNYWMKDPIGPGKGNQLPYLDGVRILVLPDASTRLAAFRTAKIDQSSGYTIEDRDALLKNARQLQYTQSNTASVITIAMKIYDPKLPYKDVRVRRAMTMAIDYKAIIRDMYKGEGEYYTWPWGNNKDYSNIWIPLDKTPASVQEMYTYNPDKARQLLKEAGYPTGFKARIIVTNTVVNVDYLSIIRDYWSKVGIDLSIEPKELAVQTSLLRNFTYDEMINGGAGGIGSYYRLIGFSGPDYWNASQVNEPYIEEVRAKIAKIFETTMDWNEIDRLYMELKPKVLEQAYYIPGAGGYSYNMWWPWLKNYYGATNLSFTSGTGETDRFVWLDQSLKKSMGY